MAVTCTRPRPAPRSHGPAPSVSVGAGPRCAWGTALDASPTNSATAVSQPAASAFEDDCLNMTGILRDGGSAGEELQPERLGLALAEADARTGVAQALEELGVLPLALF